MRRAVALAARGDARPGGPLEGRDEGDGSVEVEPLGVALDPTAEHLRRAESLELRDGGDSERGELGEDDGAEVHDGGEGREVAGAAVGESADARGTTHNAQCPACGSVGPLAAGAGGAGRRLTVIRCSARLKGPGAG